MMGFLGTEETAMTEGDLLVMDKMTLEGLLVMEEEEMTLEGLLGVEEEGLLGMEEDGLLEVEEEGLLGVEEEEMAIEGRRMLGGITQTFNS